MCVYVFVCKCMCVIKIEEAMNLRREALEKIDLGERGLKII